MLYWLMNLDFAGGTATVTANPLYVIAMEGSYVPAIVMTGRYIPALKSEGTYTPATEFTAKVDEGS